ncbi:CvpA family protein [Telluribacter sp. SYSU D00476]|uniref:CvpA family protein n=1 Tax=Telluribacter sp. SYSU D00476 TaxID=2811430 RepID=UPI001FF428E3|nr:CvpA family protein [Telluribacter sp. SYSU D00476]
MEFSFVDWILILIVLISVWSGWQRGFILGLLNLVTLIGSFLIAISLYKYLAMFLEKYVPSLGVWNLPVSFFITLILARILLSSITNSALRNVPLEAHAHGINRFLGMAPGFVNGIIYASFAAAFLMALPLSDAMTDSSRESALSNRLTQPVEWLENKLSPVFEEAVERSLNNMTVEPSSDKSVTLPFTVKNPKVRPDLEARMLELVNEERAKEGLKPLKADPELAEVARLHSRDMFARGYFAHVTPDGKDPFDRIRAAKVRFITAGENLALAQTIRIAHTGLMNSPGHRANIMRPAFGRVGIGVLDGGIHGLMITQNFRN